MKIGFLLGSPDISGGTYVIFQHAISMTRRGFDITIICEDEVSEERLFWHPDAKVLKFSTYERESRVEYDLLFATWWVTAYSLYRIRSKRYAYFVQSIESRFYPEEDVASRYWADSTYFFKLPVITEAQWIKGYLEERFRSDVRVAKNGIRKDIYSTTGEAIEPRKAGKLRVLVEGPFNVFFKNTERTIELCRNSAADEVWLLTGSGGIEQWPGVDRVFSRVSIYETAKIYRSCDVIVKLSYVEGMFGPPLEMFHCGGTSIVYDVTGHDEYILNDRNGVVIGRDDEAEVVSILNRLKASPDYLERLKQGAIETAAQWPDWDSASIMFEREVLALSALETETQESLEAKSRVLKGWFESTAALQREVSSLKKDREYAIAKHYEATTQLNEIYGSKTFQFCEKLRQNGLLKTVKGTFGKPYSQ